jgi:hypothetical protein
VTSRVKHDPNVVLRLDFGWSRPAADGPLGCVCQVLDLDVQVLRSGMALMLRRPLRSLPVLLELKVESEVGRSNPGPSLHRAARARAVLECGDPTVEKLRVELRDIPWSRGSDGDGRQPTSGLRCSAMKSSQP